ncbi:MAG: DoxX family membrane protein [Ignavibacteriales bacterium]|nr:DoxX family membrane protein [Ignavibacteriales bacterium]
MKYSNIQFILLVLIRFILGYHFLYEGFDKLFDENWSSAPFLIQSNWIFSDFFHSLTNDQMILKIIDLLNIWGQILIGFGLILGLYVSISAFMGVLMLLLYYIAIPPFQSNLLFVDKNMIELLCFLVIAFFPTSKVFGLDFLIKSTRSK